MELLVQRCGLQGDPHRLAEERMQGYARRLRADPPPAPKGLHALLDAADAAGLRMAVASSNIQVAVNAALEVVGAGDRFEFVLTGEDVAKAKPDPEIYVLSARRLGLPVSACVVVEDSTSGVAAAKAAGMFVVGYAGFGDPSAVGQADMIAHSFTDPALLQTLELPLPA